MILLTESEGIKGMRAQKKQWFSTATATTKVKAGSLPPPATFQHLETRCFKGTFHLETW